MISRTQQALDRLASSVEAGNTTMVELKKLIAELNTLKSAVSAKISMADRHARELRMLEVSVKAEALMAQAQELHGIIKLDVHEAGQAANSIHAHHKWTATVVEVFGQEGLDRCHAHMRENSVDWRA